MNGGNVTLTGGQGLDQLGGGGGADLLTGGTEADMLVGGKGGDSLNGLDGAPGDTLIGKAGIDTCSADPGDTRKSCEG